MSFAFGTNTSKAADSFSFGQAKSTTSTASFSLTPSTNTLTTSTTTTAPSLFGQAQTTSATTTAGISTLTATTATKPGLGGTGYSNTADASNTVATAQVPVKQQMLPTDIHVLVTALEGHIKKEKEESSEVAKYSQRQLNKIKENASTLELLIRSLKSNLQRETSTVDKLCLTATQLQKNVEMAQRTHDTHAALQHENVLPSRYFAELIIEFEQKLAIYRSQIDQLESHLAASSDIALAQLPQTLERLHQTFIALAAGLQIILSTMDKLKQRYLNYRRQVLGDTSDVFQRKKEKKDAVIKGPSPFAELSNLSVLAMAQLQAQPQNQPPNTGFTGANSGGGLFGGTPAAATTNAFGAKPAGSFSLGANTGGSMFGNTNTNTATSNTGTSLFGNTTTNTGGGLFGNTATNQAKPAFSFGGNTTTTPTAATGGGGGLFGNAQNKQAGTSLFGNTTTANSSTFSFGKK